MKEAIKKINNYEVLTPQGWSDFDGIKIKFVDEYYKLILSDDSIIKCTFNHLLKCNDNTFKSAEKLQINDVLINNIIIIDKQIIKEKIKVYDLLNVEKENQYYTNNVISHNCGIGNVYHKIWVNADQGLNDFHTIRLPWTVHPDRDQRWRDKQDQELGVAMAAQECLDGDTLITLYDEENKLEYTLTLKEYYELTSKS